MFDHVVFPIEDAHENNGDWSLKAAQDCIDPVILSKPLDYEPFRFSELGQNLIKASSVASTVTFFPLGSISMETTPAIAGETHTP